MTQKPEYEERRTLVVDDHEISGSHAVAALSHHTGAVRWAKTASEALRLALKWHPHIIFLDLHLPDKNGLEVINRIRTEWPANQSAAIIVVLTGDDSSLAQEGLADLDINRVLVKPVTGAQLRKVAGIVVTHEIGEPLRFDENAGLPALFRAELRQQLPVLDSSLCALDRAKTDRILHQLIASAAMCGEIRLESALRLMGEACRQHLTAGEIAACYHSLLECAREFISREH